MAAAFPASFVDAMLGTQFGSAEPGAGNRFTLEGVTTTPKGDGTLEVGIEKFEAASLRLAAGAHVLKVGRLAVSKVLVQVRIGDGVPRLVALQGAGADLSGVTVEGPLVLAQAATDPQPATAWTLAPLAAANGTIRAEIVDAHLLFDADVTVPIRQGRVDFNDATVEHVGPDSRMGVSRLGIYVDAANGRSYLYQFPSTPVVGVEFEKRGALPGPWAMKRGTLQLQPFVEALLRQGLGAQHAGITGQSRLLLDRTALSGDLRLGDGKLAAPGLQTDLVGAAQGRNAIVLRSEAVGRGLTAEIATLSGRQAVLEVGPTRVGCDEVTGTVVVRLAVQGSQVRFALDVPTLKLTGLRLQDGSAPGSVAEQESE